MSSAQGPAFVSALLARAPQLDGSDGVTPLSALIAHLTVVARRAGGRLNTVALQRWCDSVGVPASTADCAAVFAEVLDFHDTQFGDVEVREDGASRDTTSVTMEQFGLWCVHVEGEGRRGHKKVSPYTAMMKFFLGKGDALIATFQTESQFGTDPSTCVSAGCCRICYCDY